MNAGDDVGPMDYLDPVATMKRDDYEVVPSLDNYEQPHINESHYEVAPFLPPDNDNDGNGALHVGGTLPEDEEVYVDPGHEKEKIYEWLEQKRICKLNKMFIRYFAYSLLVSVYHRCSKIFLSRG